MYGCNGKILRINLSNRQWLVETFDENFHRLYLGGWGFIIYYLLKELHPGVDPLGPENILIFANGTITGAAMAGSGRSAVGAKSPLTGGFGEADVGGWWGVELSRAGYDAIIIEGQSDTPVYLWIHDDQVEFRPAEHLWGKLTARVQMMIHEELGDHRVRVAQIGPAGERLSPIAAVMHDINRAAGRTGLGAVMGSKRLKAVAVRGSKRVRVAHPKALNELAKWYSGNYKNTWALYLQDLGTDNGLANHQMNGGLPTMNFQKGVFEGYQNLTGESMRDTILKERNNCFACPVSCKRVVEIQEGPFQVDPVYGGPEYETVGSFGSICGVSNLAAVAKANELCNAYGLDTISTGVTIAWAMECFDRGLFTIDDTGGLDLRFGDAAVMVRAVELMGKREGFGRILSEGSRRASRIMGRGSEAYTVQVKGLEVPMHEPRIKYALGIGYAVSPTGADHNHNFHDSDYTTPEGIEPLKPFGITEPLDIRDLGPKKMKMASIEIPWSVVMNILGICGFVFFTIDRPKMVELANLVTGWDLSLFDTLTAGERAYTLARVFNVREGLSVTDDVVPERFSQPFTEGAAAGNYLPKEQIAQAIPLFYELMGWDAKTGVPTRQRLEALGIGWVFDYLPR